MVKSIVASYESQEKNGHNFRFFINLLRKLSSENFCRKRHYGTAPGAGLLFVPLLLGLLTLVALGIGTLLSALNVYYRDFRYVIPFLVQIGMFATPAVYMAPKDHDQSLISYGLLLNPINAVVAAFREAILGQSITWGPLAVAGALSGLIFLGGCLYFRHLEQDFADVI